jgi:4-amino-4-deoxy-L-arabinose transferase-like glycosyltransferase
LDQGEAWRVIRRPHCIRTAGPDKLIPPRYRHRAVNCWLVSVRLANGSTWREIVIERVVKALNSGQSRLHWATFAGLLAIVVILRLAAFQGYSDSDPRAYSLLANDLANGMLHIPDDSWVVFPLRLGVYAPTAVLIKVFGLSEITLAAYPFLVSIFGCLLAYALARRLGTPLAGLIGLSALAVLPIDISMASLLLPDAIAAFWANVGVALAYCALNRSKLRQSGLLGILSGGCFGVSWLCKESVAYLVPFVAILVLILHRQSRLSVRTTCLVAISVGSIAVLLAEATFWGMLTGDPLFHLHATERNYVQCAVWFFDKSSPYFSWDDGGYAKALMMRLFFTGPKEILLCSRMSFMPTLAILGAAWAAFFRQRSFVMPTIWLISLLVMFNFATSSFSSYKRLPLFDRYLYPIILPSLVIVGGFLATLLLGDSDYRVQAERRFWALVLIVGFCGISAIGVKSTMSRPEQVE